METKSEQLFVVVGEVQKGNENGVKVGKFKPRTRRCSTVTISIFPACMCENELKLHCIYVHPIMPVMKRKCYSYTLGLEIERRRQDREKERKRDGPIWTPHDRSTSPLPLRSLRLLLDSLVGIFLVPGIRHILSHIEQNVRRLLRLLVERLFARDAANTTVIEHVPVGVGDGVGLAN